jgi:hypothetical protein
MTTPLPALDGAAHALRERWRAESMASVWLRPGDWYHPAVDALAESLADGRDVTGAAERLGVARGHVGIGIGETIDDLMCLFAAHRVDPDPPALRAVSVGWSAGNEAPASSEDLVDPWTGLPTLDYLALRLRETFGDAARAGLDPRTTHALVVVDVAMDHLDRFQRLARAATMGEVLADVFGEGRPVAVVRPGVYVALCPRDEHLGGRVSTLRAAIGRAATERAVSAVLRRPPRVWIETLPASPDGLAPLLGERS